MLKGVAVYSMRRSNFSFKPFPLPLGTGGEGGMGRIS
jgi:hypothetical protein